MTATKPEARGQWALSIALAGMALLGTGPLLSGTGITPPFAGFLIFLLGILASVIAIPTGAIPLIRNRRNPALIPAQKAWIGMGLGVLVLFGIIGLLARSGNAPPINDISTDLNEPPIFLQAASKPANQDRNLDYPGETTAKQQQRAYPDIQPINTSLAPEEALTKAGEIAAMLGWESIHINTGSLHLEAEETSSLFRFVDDIVIRIRPKEGGSILDIRSKSRDGQGDLGANAKRIRKFREHFLAR